MGIYTVLLIHRKIAIMTLMMMMIRDRLASYKSVKDVSFECATLFAY